MGSYGVISIPEVTDWQPLTANDSYVIAASDGVFENLSPQDICDLLWEPLSQVTVPLESVSSCSNSLADCIVDTAFERGSMDNLAATALPVRKFDSLETLRMDWSHKSVKSDYSTIGYQRQLDEISGDLYYLALQEICVLPRDNYSKINDFNRLSRGFYRLMIDKIDISENE